MSIEFEATFVDVDIDEVRVKLEKLGAKLIQPERLMRRVIFWPPKQDELGWMRVRDEGHKITLSYKRFLGYQKEKVDISDQEEICLEINDFEQGVKLLEMTGAKKKAYQETKREEWLYLNSEICLDTWPGLEPFIEIEAQDEALVKKISQDLDLDYSQALFGPVHVVYEKKLGISADEINNHTPEITFDNPPQKKI
ncbi:MAG: CYTH domain-containing protein [Patescibacteria group bacterium]|nr:CYTH domain-containing protein [Patescibacteria group bacterium]